MNFCVKFYEYTIDMSYKNSFIKAFLCQFLSIYLAYVYIAILERPYRHLTKIPMVMKFCEKLDLYKTKC